MRMRRSNKLGIQLLCVIFMVMAGILPSSGQSFGNEWINYSQQYYKFPISKAGVYRITQNVLPAAVLNQLSTINPQRFQIFARGVEIPLFVAGEADGNFGASDYIEFFAYGNDGWLDSALYVFGGADQPNPGYSLFSDTIYYYLTWKSSGNGLRFILETDTNFAAHSSAPYYFYDAWHSFKDHYYEGRIFTAGQLSPEYTIGEGYGLLSTNVFSFDANWNQPPLSGLKPTIYSSGPAAQLRLNLITGSNPVVGGPNVDHHHVITAGGVVVTDTLIDGHGLFKRNYSIPATNLVSSTFAFEVDFLASQSASTRNGLMYYKLRIPQVFNMGGRTQQYLYLPNFAGTKSRLDITNFVTFSSTPVLYDLTNNRRITVAVNGTTLRALVPNTGIERQLYLSSLAQVDTVSWGIVPVSTEPGHFAKFRDFGNQLKDFNYIVVYPKQFQSSAEIYNAYRNQTGFQSVAINFDELQDQFGFGIPKHPMAIKNFLRMSYNGWSRKPEQVFLLGKGIKHTFIRNNQANYNASLIPSVGIPSSDNLYGFNVFGTSQQDVMIGRLAAATNEEVEIYYEKVREHEGNPPAEWMKHALHLGGGATLAEQTQLKGFLMQYQVLFEAPQFAGLVHPWYKSSSQPFAIPIVDSIRHLVNDHGVAMMTIFGHGSGQGFDLTLDEPENYQNKGKYPLVLVNSCLSGDIFQVDKLISERFVISKDKGAIGFIASTSQALSTILHTFSTHFYDNISDDDYGHTVGEAMKNAISESVQNFQYDNLVRMTALDMQLHGDPAIRLSYFTKPDLELKTSNIAFLPEIVTGELDSFDLRIIVTNIGRAITTPYTLTVTRDYPALGVPDTTYNITRPAGCLIKDTVVLTLPVNIVRSFGENIFTITADPIHQYDELNESNNQVIVKLSIASSDIIPVYPFKYQVVPDDTLTLKASTGDPFAPLRWYKFEIDTTDLFNSPFKQEFTVQQTGGVVKWHLPFELDVISPDSTVFFWRTGADSAGTGIFHHWKESSFQYIPGKYGWGQDHFFQFKDDDYLFINDNRTTRTFEFVPNFKELKCTWSQCNPTFETRYLIDGVVQEEGGCNFESSIMVAVIDPITLKPWETNFNNQNPDHEFGNHICRPWRAERYFTFWVNYPQQRTALRDMLLNSVPDGHHLLIYTYNCPTFNIAANFPPDLVNAFNSVGATGVEMLVDSGWARPYIYYVQKGNPSTALEVIGDSLNHPIELVTVLQNDWMFGTITSELIGPASEWETFFWDSYSIDANPANDSAYVNIIGVRHDGTEQILIGNIPTTTNSVSLSAISTAMFPYLKLFMYTRDDTTMTPTQLAHWHVLYKGVPEAALNPSAAFMFHADSISQGEELIFSTAVENIGYYPMDSLWIRYFIVDNSNNVHNFYHKKPPLPVGQIIIDTFKVNTASYSGINSLWIEANPLNYFHQTEQFHFNNIAARVFNVGGDKINPILDVTFDGVHIMDGDIVSARPEILIKLKDESLFQLLNDTSDFELYLKYPGQSVVSKLHFGMPEITFIPATSAADNSCYIEYRPDFSSLDGDYQLLIRARDKSNNSSGNGNGDYDFDISFMVINQSTITNVLNYPNPFSTSTQFVFTLTGSELPSEFTIQILTISGIVVREITIDELGPIHIGRNITNYRWNGTDEFGDKLANGVYIYRVIAKMNGDNIEKRQTSADKYFKQGFGKMYIMR